MPSVNVCRKNPYLNNPGAQETARTQETHEGRDYTKLTYTVTTKPTLLKIIAVVALAILTCCIALAFSQVRQLGSKQINHVSILLPLWKSPLETIEKLKNCPITIQGCFNAVNSAKLEPEACSLRADFIREKAAHTYSPLIISKSPFVSHEMASHLVLHKKSTAIGEKYKAGDVITNMEGALHTFVTPIAKIKMTGDYCFDPMNGHGAVTYPGNSRTVVLSAAIHPDFECSKPSEVVMPLIECKDRVPTVGISLENGFEPLSARFSPGTPEFLAALKEHDDALLKHMVYHLRGTHQLPTRQEVADSIVNAHGAQIILEKIIRDGTITNVAKELEDLYVTVNGHIVSFEALFMIYYHQIRNELSVLEETLTQGYVYTISPPAIFAKQFGKQNVPLLNRLQVLAFKQLQTQSSFENLQILGFDDYADKGVIPLYQALFPTKEIVSKNQLFQDNGLYSGTDGYALVEHNNSDAFGNNIATEGPTSKDGVVGVYSNASLELDPERPDLLDIIY